MLFATGDVMAQQAVERIGFDKHNFARTGRMALYGGGESPATSTSLSMEICQLITFTSSAVFGPAATTWFKFLQNKINLKNPNTTIGARVLADQCIFASTNLFVFLSSMAIMEGTSPKDKLESTYTTALTKNWMVWPWVQAINFKLVPLEHRVLVVNVVSLGKCCLDYQLESDGADESQ